MRLVQFQDCNTFKLGVEQGQDGDVVDLCSADSSLPTAMSCFLNDSEAQLKKASTIVSSGGFVLPSSKISLKAPITRPEKIILACNNTYDHVEELGLQPSKHISIVNKYPSCIVGPNDVIKHPGDHVTQCVDYGVEMAVVMGRTASCISESNAMDHVVGFTILNDVSARDIQLDKNYGQMSFGQCLDTFCPLGPAIVTKDEINDPYNLDVQLKVNGQIRQESNTKNYIFKASSIISHISSMVTLRPGEVVSLGTFAGVGYKMNPQQFLKPGDVMECKIEGLGILHNQVV